MPKLPAAALSAVGSEVFGYLAKSGVQAAIPEDHLRAWLGSDLAQVAFQVSLARAFATFSSQYPEYAESLFDQAFLGGRAAPLLARCLSADGPPDAAELATLWADELGLDGAARQVQIALYTPLTSDFLRWLAAELRTQEAFRHILDSRTLDAKAADPVRTAQAAERPRQELESTPAQANKYEVTVHKAEGLVVGDNATVTNIFQTFSDGSHPLDERLTGQDADDRLDDKLSRYAANLATTQQFSDWSLQSYFELRLGHLQSTGTHGALSIRMRLKTPPDTMSTQPQEKYTIEGAINNFGHLAVIGEPGSGKTTMLKRLALAYADQYCRSLTHGQRSNTAALPIYIWLPYFNSVTGSTPYDRITALIRYSLQRSQVLLDDAEWRSVVNRGTLFLLFDGLNEVGDRNLDPLMDGLQAFTSNHPHHLLIVTSRTYNVRLQGHTLPVLELLELTYPHDIEHYIQGYLGADRASVTGLLRILEQNLQLRQLAVNPLLLFMIILVFQSDHGHLPSSRARLFRRLAYGLLGLWDAVDEAQVPRQFWSDDKHLLLQGLGYAMKDEGLELAPARVMEVFQATLQNGGEWFSSRNPARPRGYAPPNSVDECKAVVEELKRDRILLQDDASGRIRFWHQTHQEYFAASQVWHLVAPSFDGLRSGTRPTSQARRHLKRALDPYIADARWHEILAIASGLVDGPAADTPVRWRDSVAAAFVDIVWHRNKLLAAMCISNMETPPDEAKLTELTGQISREVDLAAIVLPRLLPWLLFGTALAVVWLAPLASLSSALDTLWHTSESPGFAALPGVLVLGTVGSATAVLFFRLYSGANLTLETVTNELYLRPGLAALRHIRSEYAERLLSELLIRVRDDFTIGDTTRQTIETGLVLPVRGERELILMLDDPGTRTQAMERLVELRSVGAVAPLMRLIDSGNLGRSATAHTIEALVKLARLLPDRDATRYSVESLLKSLVESRDLAHAERLDAYRGLREMGITGITPPSLRLTDTMSILLANWPLVLLVMIALGIGVVALSS